MVLGAGSCQVPSRLCSVGAGGTRAQGPAAHSSAATRHACHRRIEVPTHPCWGPLPQRPVCTHARPRGAARSIGVQLAPLSLCSSVQTVLEGKEKSSLHACCLSVLGLPPAEEMEGLDTSLYVRVRAGYFRDLQERPVPLGCSLITLCCHTTRDLRQGRLSLLLSHPRPFVPFPWAWPHPMPQVALSAAHCLPLGLSRKLRGRVGLLRRLWEFRSVSWGRRNSRITATTLCPLCRP